MVYDSTFSSYISSSHFNNQGWACVSKLKITCPACGAKDECSIGIDGAVRCEKTYRGTRSLLLDLDNDYEQYTPKSSTQSGNFYRPKKKQKRSKKPRESKYRYWTYKDEKGKPVLQVRRWDYKQPEDGKYKKIVQHLYDPQNQKADKYGYVPGLHGLTPDNWALLNFEKIQEAIAKGEPIFAVEGEPIVNLLTDMGLVAVTCARGSSGFHESQWQVLKGYWNLVLCPDRDRPGMDLMLKIQAATGATKWLYAFPNRKFPWMHLHSSDGSDILNWVKDEKITKEQLLAAVTTEQIKQLPSFSKDNLSAQPEKVTVDPTKKIEELKVELFELAAKGLDGIDLDLQITRIATKYKKQERLIRRLYYSAIEEIEADQNLNAVLPQLHELLSGEKRQVDLDRVFPPELAKPLKLSIKKKGHSAAALSVLTVLGILMNEMSIELKNDWHERAIIHALLVGDSGSWKSVVLKKVMKPLQLMQEKIDEETERLENKKEEALNVWLDMKPEDKRAKRGTEEDPNYIDKLISKQRKYYETDVTPEALNTIIARQERGSGVLHFGHEAGTVYGFDAYKSNPNNQKSKKQRMTAWDEGLRGSITRQDKSKCLRYKNQFTNVLSAIQPRAMRTEFSNFNRDDDGELSRITKVYIESPTVREAIEWNKTRVDVTALLLSVYQAVEALPNNLTCKMTPEAERKFVNERAKYIIWQYRDKSSNPSFSQWIAKMVTMLARICLILHAIEGACDKEKDLRWISGETMDKAIYFCEILIANELHLQRTVPDCNSDFIEEETKTLGQINEVFEYVKQKRETNLRKLLGRFQTRGNKKGLRKKEIIAYLEQLAKVTKEDSNIQGFIKLIKDEKGNILNILFLDEEDGGGGGDPPSNPTPDGSPDSDIEQQVRSQIQEAQLDLPPSVPVVEPVLAGVTGSSDSSMSSISNKTAIAFGASEGTIAPSTAPLPDLQPLTSTAVMEKTPEVQQISGKGFGQQSQIPVEEPPLEDDPIEDDRNHPRFDLFKKTGTIYLLARDRKNRNRSVLMTDEFIGTEIKDKKINSVPVKLEEIEATIGKTFGTYKVLADEKAQDPNGEWVLVDTSREGETFIPLAHHRQVPLSEIHAFIYSDSQSDR